MSELQLETISCPLCDSASHTPVATRVDGLTIVRCSCGSCFLNPRPRPEYVKELYRKDYYSGFDRTRVGYADYKPTVAMVKGCPPFGWELLVRHTRLQGARALDVGCAFGRMVYWMRRAGARAVGVDLSPEGVMWGRRHLKVDLREGSFESLNEGPFDVVTLMDVIEHVVDLRGFMHALRRLTGPRSIVMVQTPNFASFQTAGAHSVHLLTALEHLLYFEPVALDRLFREFQFVPIEPTAVYRTIPPMVSAVPPNAAPPMEWRPLLKKIPLVRWLNDVRHMIHPVHHQYVKDPTGVREMGIFALYRRSEA